MVIGDLICVAQTTLLGYLGPGWQADIERASKYDETQIEEKLCKEDLVAVIARGR